ncbi:MAG: hypothetical protein OXU43_02675, partial [Gammaproteobacteria bacterium]|nr:hypothetical protein [Gammaproteobacteria bacterium]
ATAAKRALPPGCRCAFVSYAGLVAGFVLRFLCFDFDFPDILFLLRAALYAPLPRITIRRRTFLKRSAKRALYTLDSCFRRNSRTVCYSRTKKLLAGMTNIRHSRLPLCHSGLFFCHSGESRNPSYSCDLGIAKEREARAFYAGFRPAPE